MAGEILCNLESALRTEGIIIMLCIFIFNLREILATIGCQEMLSCRLCSTGKSGLSGELHGAQFIYLGNMDEFEAAPAAVPVLGLAPEFTLNVCLLTVEALSRIWEQGCVCPRRLPPHLPHLLGGSAWIWASAFNTASLQI